MLICDDYFQNEQIDYSQYHQNWAHIFLNPQKNANKIYGEATPVYMYWQECMERIKEYNPQMKLIFILRNPIDRAYSHWNMNVEKEGEINDLRKALRLEKIRRLTSKEADRLYSYTNRGFYSQQIEKILTLFPREQMWFLKNEDLKNNHQQTLNKIFDFLNIDNCNTIESEKVNYRLYKPMEKSDRDFLAKK